MTWASNIGPKTPAWIKRAERERQQDEMFRLSIERAQKHDPNRSAKDQANARDLGIPLEIVESDPERADTTAALKKIHEETEGTKHTRKFLSNPEAAKVAQNDVKSLVDIEGYLAKNLSLFTKIYEATGGDTQTESIKGLGRSLASGTRGLYSQLLQIPGLVARGLDFLQQAPGIKQANELLGTEQMSEALGIKLEGTFYESLKDATPFDEMADRQQVMASAYKDVEEYNQRAEVATDKLLSGEPDEFLDLITDPKGLAVFIGQAIPSFAAAAMSGGSLKMIALLEGLEVASDAAELEEITGQKIAPNDFMAALVQTMTVNSLLERLGVTKALGARGLTDILKAGITEMGTEGLQAFNTNLSIYTHYNANKSLTGGVLAGALGGFGVGAGGSTLSAIGQASGPDSSYMSDALRADKALNFSAAMDDLVEMSKASETRGIAPAQYRTFLEDQLGVENSVYIAPEDARAFFQTNPEVLQALPEDTRERVTEALNTGEDVAIPTVDYLTTLSDHHEELAPNLRNDIDGMTRTEADEWAKTGQSEFEADAERIMTRMENEAEVRESADRVAQNIEQQLVQTGRMTPQAARQNAALHRAVAITVASRTGMTPEQVYERFGLRVQGEPLLSEGFTQAEQWEQRAREMGFDTAQTWYHGSPEADITEFDITAPKHANVVGDIDGFFFSNEPHVASGYTRRRGLSAKELRKLPRGRVYSVYLKMQNPLDITDDIKNRPKGTSFGDAKRAALQKLDRSVHDSVIFRGDDFNSPEAIVFESSQIRSVKAEFDPAMAESGDILAQGPLPDAMDQYRSEQEARPIKDVIKEPLRNKDGEYRKNAQGDITGAPVGVKTDAQVQAIVNQNVDHIEDPLSQMPSSAEWYEVSGAAIRSVTRGDPELTERLIRIMAVLSAANQVGANTTGAVKAIYQLARGETAAAGRFPNDFAKAIPHILKAHDLSLDTPKIEAKVMSFYRNLWDATFLSNKYENAATMDMWMARLYGYKTDTFGPAQYRFANMVTQMITDQYNAKHETSLKPRQIQAALWVYARNRERYGEVIGASIALEDRSAFDTYIERAKQHITVEAVPSVNSGLFPEIHLATPEQRTEYTRRAIQLILNENGENELFRRVGIPLYQMRPSEGTFEGVVNPNEIMSVVSDKRIIQGGKLTRVTGLKEGKRPRKAFVGPGKPSKVRTEIPGPTRKIIVETKHADLAAQTLQYIYTQDGVPWMQLDPTATGANQGVAVYMSAQPTIEMEEAFLAHLSKTVEADFTRIGNDLFLLNFNKYHKTENPDGITDQAFKQKVVAAINSYTDQNGPGAELMEEWVDNVKARSNYHAADWKNEAETVATLERQISDAGGQDLLRWARDRREAVARLQADFRDENLAQFYQGPNVAPFDLDFDHRIVPADKLIDYEEAHAADRAAGFLEQVEKGKLEPRRPPSVRENADGTYTVIDGRSGTTAAINAGYTQIPVRVIDSVFDSKTGEVVEVTPELEALYEKAGRAKDHFDKPMEKIAQKVNGVWIDVPLKGRKRTMQKAYDPMEYNGDLSRMKDMLRGTISVNTLKDAEDAYNFLVSEFKPIEPPKMSLTEGDKMLSGYKDIKVVIEVDGVKSEIQINTKDQVAAKEILGHEFYDLYRDLPIEENAELIKAAQAIEAKLYKETYRMGKKGTESMDPVLKAIQRVLPMVQDFNRAFSADIKVSNSAFERMYPLWAATPALNFRGGSVSKAKQVALSKSSATGMPSTSSRVADAGIASKSVISSIFTSTESIAETETYYQSEAAEYRQAVAKGLPMDTESRMARAREQGYDTETVWYRGVDARHIDEDGTIFLTQDAEWASRFATGETLSDEAAAGRVPAVTKNYIRVQNTFDVRKAEHRKRAGIPDEDKDAGYELLDYYSSKIKEAGFDSYIDYETESDSADSIAVFDPSQIRSINAAFDPDFAESGNILAQTKRGENRGAISFDEQGGLISLLEGADPSTFLHESGHFFFEMYKELAAESPEIAQDLQTLLDYIGVPDLNTWNNMTLEQRRQGHEQVARAFEAYLFEGKSPSLEMQSLFDTFRSWLIEVYKYLRNLNVNLTDEVREVFDRMLASEEQIKARQVANGYAPIFGSQEEGAMTARQWQEYQEQQDRAAQDAVSDLERRSLRDMQWLSNAKSRRIREMQASHKRARAEMKKQVTQELKSSPVYHAINFVRTGEYYDGEGNLQKADLHKLNRAEFRENYPNYDLPRNWTEEDGILADNLAELLGWKSGDEMMEAMLNAAPLKEQIERVTDQRMLEEHGELPDQAAMNAAADEAVRSDAHTRFLNTELEHLRKGTGITKVSHRAAKAYAETAIRRRKARNIKAYEYARAEARAGRNAMRALQRGDRVEAAQHKRAQVISNHFYRAARNAEKDIEKAVRYFKKFNREGTRKNLHIDYLEQIDKLLERYDFRKKSLKEIDRRKSLKEWVEQQREMGFEPVIDERLLSDAELQHYADTSFEELMGLYDTVKNIEHLGRLKTKLLRAQKNQDIDTIANIMASEMRKNSNRKTKLRLENNSWWDSKKEGIDDYFAMHRKFSSFAREMDGNKWGPVWEYWIRPMNEAGDFEASERAKATEALHDIFAPILKGPSLQKKTKVPGTNFKLSREGRLTVALNVGNEGNRQRLSNTFTDQQVDAILDTLTQEEWNFVQSVWDYIDSFWPAIAAKERRLSNVKVEKVERTPVETKYGTMQGGYYPILYDPRKSGKAAGQEAADLLEQAKLGKVSRATTRRGHVEARQEQVGREIRLDLGGVFRHVDQVIHDLAWHEYLVDANRLLRHGAIDGAIREAYGPEIVNSIRKTLEDIAVGEMPAQNAFERGINHLRTGVTIAGLGWSVWTSFLQPIGLTQSMVRIGPQWVGRGLMEWLGSAARMENAAKKIYEKSTFMRLRSKTLMREINEIQNKVSAGPTIPGWQASYFYFITKLQLVADIPTWLGQYEKSISEGFDESSAVAQADQAVLDSQSGGQIKDLAQIQRGTPMLKLFTNFYSYFNMTWNLTAESFAKNVRGAKHPGHIGRFAVDMLLLYSLPATLAALMREATKGRCDWDDEECVLGEVVKENLSYMAGVLVGVRELSGILGGFYGYSGPAGTRFFSEVGKLTQQSMQGEIDKAWLKAANQSAGILFHYPATQVQRTVEGFVAIQEGDVEGVEAVTAPLFGAPPQ